ncbi:MAG TPA: hypothetical protein VFX70_05660 [Mycobacteriales bacterium]|nr:hypothetical protein [Mycobacteriales bacterium]
MTNPERRELEDQLRRALNDAAARIHPAGDGLDRIRERAQRRHRRLGWMRPALGVAAATVVVALAATVPLYLHSTSTDRGTALGSTTGTATGHRTTLTATPAHPVPTSEPESATTHGSSASGGISPTQSSPALPDMTTVWPYGSRREGGHRADQDVADQVHPALRDPRQTALEFIRSFVGTSDPLVADRDTPLAAGIGVTVSRQTGDGNPQPVSLVYLVRVRRGDDAPYVVVDASRPPLDGSSEAMSVQPGMLQGVAPLMVTGTVTPTDPTDQANQADQIASVKVELREPGQDQTLASQSPVLSPNPNQTQEQTWTAMLTPIRPLSTPTGTVAAWTVDAENHLLNFVAAPTSPPKPVRSGEPAR